MQVRIIGFGTCNICKREILPVIEKFEVNWNKERGNLTYICFLQLRNILRYDLALQRGNVFSQILDYRYFFFDKVFFFKSTQIKAIRLDLDFIRCQKIRKVEGKS